MNRMSYFRRLSWIYFFKIFIKSASQIKKQCIWVQVELISRSCHDSCNVFCCINSSKFKISFVLYLCSNKFSRPCLSLSIDNLWFFLLSCLFNDILCSFCLLLSNLFLFNCSFKILTELEMSDWDIFNDDIEVSCSRFQILSNFGRHTFSLGQ